MTVPRYPLLVLLLLGLYALATHFHLYDYASDYWHYAAIIQDMASESNRQSPSPEFRAGGYLGTMPYNYNPYLWILATLKNLLGLNPFTLLYAAGLCNFVLLAIGLHLFLKKHFFDPYLSFYMLPVMLFFWGKSWDFNGAYDIDAQMLNLCYPSTFAMAVGFFLLAFFERYQRAGNMRDWMASLCCLSLTLLTNLLPSVFVLGTMGILVFLKRNWSRKKILGLLGLGMGTAVLVHAWPYYSLFQLLKSGATHFLANASWYIAEYPEAGSSWGLLESLERLGPALLGLPLLVYYVLKKRYPLATFGFTLFFVIYLIAFLLKITMGWRLIFFVTFFLHLAIALYLRERLPLFNQPVSPSRQNSFAVFLVCTATACLIYQTMSITTKQLGFHSFKEAFAIVQNNPSKGRGFARRFHFLTQYVPPDAVVLSDRNTSLIITALNRKTVPFQAEEPKRFFDKDLPLAGRRQMIRKHHVQYVLWNSERVLAPFPEDLKKIGKIIYQKDALTLLNVP